MASQFAWNHFHTVNNEWLKLIKTFDLTYLSGLKQTRKVDLGDPGSSHFCKKENNNNNNNNNQLCLRGLHITVKRLTNPWPSNSRSNWN